MQRGIFTSGVFQKKKKDISLWEQLFDSRQAVVTGKYIRPDLVCFGCFGDVAIMRDRGLVIEQGQCDSFFFIQPSCSRSPLCFCFIFLPVSLSYLIPAGVKLCDFFMNELQLV